MDFETKRQKVLSYIEGLRTMQVGVTATSEDLAKTLYLAIFNQKDINPEKLEELKAITSGGLVGEALLDALVEFIDSEQEPEPEPEEDPEQTPNTEE